MSDALTGTAPLIRTTVRHDGQRFAPFIAIATGLAASSVLIYPLVFPTEADRSGLAVAISSNPALGLIFGPARDITTADGFAAWRSLALGGFLAAMGAIFAVTRATRAQEDSGQAELLASGVLGRSSRLLTAIAVAFGGSLILGLMVGPVTVLFGGAWESSMLLGATFTATGWMFGSLAAVTAQIGSDSRMSNSMAVGTLGSLFMLRGFAYSIEAPEWTVWVNPLGWMQETQPAAGNYWWPLLLAVGLSMGLLTLAFVLQARRDFGMGAIISRPGPDRGQYLSSWRLVLRLNRSPYITWTVALVLLGTVFGYFTTSIKDILGPDSALSGILAAGAVTEEEILFTFLVTILSMVGIIAAVPGVQTMVKMRTEEMEDRVEPIIATATTRYGYYTSNISAAIGSSSMFMLIAGTIIALFASNADIGVSLDDALLQAVATVPAVWTVVALSVAVIGMRPRAIIVAWAGILVSFVLTLLGPTFGLDDWVLGISPFWHIPHVGLAAPDFSGLAWITAVTVLFLASGLTGFNRRDLAV